jgi:hypothetical protein
MTMELAPRTALLVLAAVVSLTTPSPTIYRAASGAAHSVVDISALLAVKGIMRTHLRKTSY